MPPLGLWVGCEEARIIGMVTAGRRATQSVSEDTRNLKDDEGEKKRAKKTHILMNSSTMTDRSKYLVTKMRLGP